MVDTLCTACQEPVFAGDHFCESCGAEVVGVVAGSAPSSPAAPGGCVDCGAATIDKDGYCEQCGRRQPLAHDHIEIELAHLAGVSDKGHVHVRNEDAMAIVEPDAHPGAFAVVVCDGVSTSQLADEASRVAADAALAVLVKAIDDPAVDLAAATIDAITAAQAAASALPFDHTKPLDPPSCTYVSAVRRPTGPIVTASVGDTRAYWFAGGVGTRLSADDSWAADQIANGVDQATAEADPRAHAITHWLGSDAPEPKPHLVTQAVDGPGCLVVCSDGLWNYASTVDQLAGMVLAGTPLEAARTMNQFALDAGGHDNITVVVVDVGANSEENPE